MVCKLLVVACRYSSLTKDEPEPPALGAQSLKHWTHEEVLNED